MTFNPKRLFLDGRGRLRERVVAGCVGIAVAAALVIYIRSPIGNTRQRQAAYAQTEKPKRQAALDRLLGENICRDSRREGVLITRKDGSTVGVAWGGTILVDGYDIRLTGAGKAALEGNPTITFAIEDVTPAGTHRNETASRSVPFCK